MTLQDATHATERASPAQIGSHNGVSRRRPFDRWFRYPAGFSPDALHRAFEAVGGGGGGWLVDPFAGSASAGTVAIARGWRFAGIESHPGIAELASLKLSRPGPTEGLSAAAEAVVASAARPAQFDSEASLVRRCFDAETLAVLVGLRKAIQSRVDDPWRNHLKWALLASLRDLASVKVGWPYQRPGQARVAPHADPTKRFLERVGFMSADLAEADPPLDSLIVSADARESVAWSRALSDELASACVSSPPYLNNFDYADATRLELYFWGDVSTWREMCDTVRAGMLVATTQQTRQGVSPPALSRLDALPAVGPEVRRLADALAAERLKRNRGKEYDWVIGPYFSGIASVLGLLFDNLKPGGLGAWTVGDSAPYGVYVDTPRLIVGLAADLGFDVVDDIFIRSRGDRWRTNGTRHQVALSERLVVVRRPGG